MKQIEVFTRSAGPFLKNSFMSLWVLKICSYFVDRMKFHVNLQVGIQSPLYKGEQGKNLRHVESAATSH